MLTVWLLVHLASTACLAGVGWLVQAVVYPGFRLVGPVQWPTYHRRHMDRITRVIALPWSAQVVSVILLLVVASSWAAAVLAGLAVVTVLATIVGAVPVHARIGPSVSDRKVTLLLRANLIRTLAWTASTAITGIVLVAAVRM